VISAPGDRRDEDIFEAGKILAGHFDYYICKADDNRRNRGHDEVPKMLQKGLIDKGVDPITTAVIPNEVEAIDAALNMAQDNDLVVVFGDSITRSWKQIIHFNDNTTNENTVTPQVGPDQKLSSIIDENDTLIRDEKGVRIARNEGGDSD
jgi:cyanophycin synthetase